MKKYILFGGYLLLLAYITSCDDGRIYEKTETLSEEGRPLTTMLPKFTSSIPSLRSRNPQ